jgi:thioesterase domain-containing protein
MSPADYELRIRQEIPTLKDFPFRITSISENSIEVQALLKDHLNHKGTAFGGSLYQVALVAAYGLFFHLLEGDQLTTRDFVIAFGEMNYRAAVSDDFTATVSVRADEKEKFLAALRLSGKSDLSLHSKIVCQGRECARFNSRFVAFYPSR